MATSGTRAPRASASLPTATSRATTRSSTSPSRHPNLGAAPAVDVELHQQPEAVPASAWLRRSLLRARARRRLQPARLRLSSLGGSLRSARRCPRLRSAGRQRHQQRPEHLRRCDRCASGPSGWRSKPSGASGCRDEPGELGLVGLPARSRQRRAQSSSVCVCFAVVLLLHGAGRQL